MLTSLRYRLLAYYYVSWKMAFPDHLKEIGLPFDDAYALAGGSGEW